MTVDLKSLRLSFTLRFLCFLVAVIVFEKHVFSQAIPAKELNIPSLVTFGNEASTSWGDDDNCQIFFFVIPETYKQPVYIRIFDPDISGINDERRSEYNTEVKFSVYGGKGCISDPDADHVQPEGKFRSGNLLAEKTFAEDSQYDNNWYTFRPISPTEGELDKNYGGYVIKIIAMGISGDDGNLYTYFLSTKQNANEAIEGSNSFTYEYCFRLHDSPDEISHLYPYLDDKVISVKQSNFDWDNDGRIFFVSVKRKAVEFSKSPDNGWAQSEHEILEEERNSSLDIQLHKQKTNPVNKNNVVFYITNQYGEMLPFYNIPIGGIPRPKSSIKITPSK